MNDNNMIKIQCKFDPNRSVKIEGDKVIFNAMGVSGVPITQEYTLKDLTIFISPCALNLIVDGYFMEVSEEDYEILKWILV